MDFVISITLISFVLGFYVYRLYRQEIRLQAAERRISEANNTYYSKINKKERRNE